MRRHLSLHASPWLLPGLTCTLVGLSGCARAQDQAPGAPQRLLLSPIEPGSGIHAGGWRLNEAEAQPAPAAITPKFGSAAMIFSGKALGGGSKGDYGLVEGVPGTVRTLSLWVNLEPDSNVSEVGFQLYDGEGEALIQRVPADWQGWKQLQVKVDAGAFTQAYPQKEKNKQVDQPLRSVHFVWFTKAAGPTQLTVDALEAETILAPDANRPAVRTELSGSDWTEPGAALKWPLLLTNFTGQPVSAEVSYSLQRNPQLYDRGTPDPVYGTDHALGAKSWSESDGKTTDDGSLTDNDPNTAFALAWGGKYTEAFQYIDLGSVRPVNHLSYQSGDANWVWKVDVAASTDGKNYQNVDGLQNLDFNKKWGDQEIEVPKPFSTRFIRFRYHDNGATHEVIRMPSRISVFDGLADEKWEFPQTGEEAGRGTATQQVPARAYADTSLKSEAALEPGAYLLSVRIKAAGSTQLISRPFFVAPPVMKAGPESRFGLNASQVSYAPLHERLGIGWVRFENMKFPFTSPAPNEYRFDGSVGPWNVPHDDIFETYRKNNLRILPFLFMIPEYATTAPAGVQRNRLSYPPKDMETFADFVYQTVARYGHTPHPAAELKTKDQKSGLGLMDTFEIWNEPNLNNKDWGAWVGSMEQYYALYRPAAEAVKKADPTAKVTNGGFAGVELDVVDTLRSFKYPDGKTPLDFTDVLNAHYYTGRVPPENSTQNPNIDRSGRPAAGEKTLEDLLRALHDWRDRYKPNMPIWITETGYDTSGPYGIGERLQAARLPRTVMLGLGNGAEKVFVYREAGSTPGQHAAAGLTRNDTTLKPSWFSYATLLRELQGTKGGQRLPYPDQNVRLFAFPKGKDVVLSAWTVQGIGKLALKFGQATVVDTFGHSTKGVVSEVALSEFPVYIRDYADPAAANALVAQAAKADADRKARGAKLEKLTSYLFDFGGTESVGTLELGTVRRFTPVLKDDVFDPVKGYGLMRPATSNSDAKWMSDPLNQDSVRLNGGNGFQFKAAPGRYTLKVGLMPVGGSARLKLTGVTPIKGVPALEFTKDKPIQEMEVTVGAEPVILTADDYSDLRWLSLVEAEK